MQVYKLETPNERDEFWTFDEPATGYDKYVVDGSKYTIDMNDFSKEDVIRMGALEMDIEDWDDYWSDGSRVGSIPPHFRPH